MSDMTVLFKDEIKKYDTDIHQDFNEWIVTKKDYEDDDLFGFSKTEHIPKQGKFKFLKKEEGEESFVKNYGNPLASTFMVKRTLVIEENESKIALKVYTYVSSRDVGKKFFKVRRVIDYFTFNFKRKLFYSGTLNLKKKRKIGGVMSINKTDINSIEVIRKIENFEKNENQNEYPVVSEKKLTKKCLNIFLDRIIERLNLNIDSDSDNIRKKYYQLFLEISGVKYPNAFEKFAAYYTPKKEIKNFGVSRIQFCIQHDDLIYEYTSKWQDCIDDVVKDIILGEIAKPFDKFGIKEIHRGYRFETTVGVLLHWYSDVENDKFTLSELLNKLIKLYDKKDRGYWRELEYDVYCDDWDDNVIQSYYSKSLDEMLEKIEEDDSFIDIDKYNEIIDHVEAKYGYDWVKTKKDPDIQFVIIKVQPETNKVLVNVHNDKTKKYHQRLLDLDGLYQLDNQPELFNERRIVSKKFL